MIRPSRLALALALAALGSQAVAADLGDVLAAADANDPQWKATRASYMAQREVLGQGRAGVLPSVVLSGEESTGDQEDNITGLSTGYDTSRMALTVTQPLLRFDRWFQYQSARASRSRVDAEFVATEQDYLIRVAETYFNVLRASEQLAFARAEEAAFARQLEQARQRFNVGLIAITDVHETQATYDLAKVGLIVAQSDLTIALSQLETLTGQRYDTLSFPGEDMPVELPDPADANVWADRARESNARLIAAREAARAAKQNARSATSGHLPNVDLFAQRANNEIDYDTVIPPSVDTTTDTVGVQFNWPLFAGGGISSQRRQANLEADAAQEQLLATERVEVERARTLYRIVEADVLRVAARKQAIVSAQSALDATTAGYEVGTRNVVDVLQAQRLAFAARRDLANARYDYLIDRFRLNQAAGGLARENLQAVDPWLTLTLTPGGEPPPVIPASGIPPVATAPAAAETAPAATAAEGAPATPAETTPPATP